MDESERGDLQHAAEQALNAGGHGLVDAAYLQISKLLKRGSRWVLEGKEFPYQIGERDGRVDLVLKHADLPVYLCMEFKRTDPRYRRWVFARGGQSRFGRESEYAFLDGVSNFPAGVVRVCGYEIGSSLEDAYTTALVGPGEADKSWKPGESEFEKAAAQAYSGALGFLEHFASDRIQLPLGSPRFAIPMIVTTTDLVVVKKSLIHTDLPTGKISLNESDLALVDLLYYQYPGSPGLRPSGAAFASVSATPAMLLDAAFIRTIPVLKATALERALAAMERWAQATKHLAGGY